MAKFGLGRGLDALLDENNSDISPFDFSNDDSSVNISTDSNVANVILEIELSKVQPNPYQPRKEFSESELNELADSIREHGIIEPIIVVAGDDGNYILVGGERRTRAARLAGLQKIPACVKQYSPEKMLEIAIIENIQREDLNALEEAMAYQQLMNMSNLTQDEVAKRVGKNRSTVANAIRLLKLPVDMQRSLAEGKISAGHARAILSVENASDQQILHARIVGSNLSVREAENMASELNAGANGKSSSFSKKDEKIEKRDPDIVALEQKLIEKFGTKVQIRGGLDHGIIQIEYFSDDDLDRLYEIWIGD